MNKWLKLFLVVCGFLLLISIGIFLFLQTKSKERISFINLHPSYKLTLNEEVLKQVMHYGPQGQITTWHPQGDKFAARKIWVVLEPWSASGYPTNVRREGSNDYTYSYNWVKRDKYEILFIRVNDKSWRVWTPVVQNQLLNIVIFRGAVERYPTADLPLEEITVRLGKIFLDFQDFPLKITRRL